MTFKAKLHTHYFMLEIPNSQKNEIFTRLNEVFKFTKQEVLFSRNQIAALAENLNLNPFGVKFKDNTPYTLKIVKERGITRYQIYVDNFPVELVINKWNEFKLNWMFRNYWIQKSDSNWLKQALLTSLLSVVTYFVGQRIGFNKGYENGLKEAKTKAQETILQQLPISNNKNIDLTKDK